MKRTFLLALVALLAAFFMAGCKDTKRTSISSILQRPETYIDRPVILAGEVTKVYAVNLLIAEAGAYQIDDGTGKIWVITRTGVPKVGSKVGLKGRVSNGARLGKEVVGAVIKEGEHRKL